MTAALRWAAPRTNSSSGSVVRHSALETHVIRSSASTLGSTPGTAARFVRRAAGRVPDTSCSLPPGRELRPPTSGADPCSIYATPCTTVLFESHRVSKLGGQVAIAQQSDNAFFGTRVQSCPEG